jgi:hypothetical protein
MIQKITRSGILNIKVILLFHVLVFSSVLVVSQSLKTINLKDIPQRKVRKYIMSRSIDQMQDFSLIHASWNKESDESDFNVNEETFYLNYDLPYVWDCYRHTNPYTMWNGRSFRFGLMISKSLNSVIYVGNHIFPEVDTSQIYFLDLKLLKGLCHVAVAFEITNIDENRRIMEFSYIDNNKEMGKQNIQFFVDGDGGTRIVHRSYFKSESFLRDHFFYPYFHKKFIEDFHQNMNQFIKNIKTLVIN